MGKSIDFGTRALVLSACTLCLLARPAKANLVITAAFDNSITSDPNSAAIEAALDSAIQSYERLFLDPISVAITFQEMASGLGSSSVYYGSIPYSAYVAALTADATTATDKTVLAHLPTGSSNPVTGSAYIDVKTPNLRAIGFSANPPGGQPDGTVGINTHITDIGSPGTSGQYSLISTAEHEIDEVLGLGSGLPGSTIFPEDLFRYDGSGNRSFAAGSSAAYFSIDGTTRLAQFNNASNGGDFGDWQSAPLPTGVQPEVQDAFATAGVQPALGTELTALDAIGYSLVAPEPATWLLFGSALLCLGFGRSRRIKAQR